MIAEIIIGCLMHLVPMMLWIILGIYSHVSVVYYIVLAVLSVVDVLHMLILAKTNIRYIRQHREELQ